MSPMNASYYLSKSIPQRDRTKRRILKAASVHNSVVFCADRGPKIYLALQIFSGSHCFPLSPKKVVFDADGLPSTEGDVLESIFDLIGTPDETDLAFITDIQA